MATIYSPDPEFYDKQIKEQEKVLARFVEASYDSRRRGYVVDGEVLSETQRQSRVNQIKREIRTLKADKKKFGPYGPTAGPKAEANELGRTFMQLVEQAKKIKVTDFNSATRSLQAWKAVDDFVKANPEGVLVVARREIDRPDQPGADFDNVAFNPYTDAEFQFLLERGYSSALETARQQAERGTTKRETVVKGNNAAATESTRTTVTNQAELDRRLAIVDNIASGFGSEQTRASGPGPEGPMGGRVIPSPAARQRPTGPGPVSPQVPVGQQNTTRPEQTTSATQQAPVRQQTGSPQSLRAFEYGATRPSTTDTKDQNRTNNDNNTTNDDGTSEKNRNGGRGTGINQPRLTDAQIDASIRKNYPEYAYMLDNPDLFGRDVLRVMRRATREGWTFNRFEGAVRRTKYWQNTVQSARQFDAMAEADRQVLIDKAREEIDQYTDVAALDETSLTTFARDMARRGITGDQLRPLVYRFAFQQGAETAAAEEAMVSQNAQAIRQVANQYGVKVDDSTLQGLLEQGETAESVQRKYVARMKAQYPQLREQLDAGLTFRDITDDYRRIAANVLELPFDNIDFTEAKYMDAVATPQENGTYRQLSLGEWQEKLRSDEKYGYHKTKQAVRDATTLAASIARSFGKVV